MRVNIVRKNLAYAASGHPAVGLFESRNISDEIINFLKFQIHIRHFAMRCLQRGSYGHGADAEAEWTFLDGMTFGAKGLRQTQAPLHITGILRGCLPGQNCQDKSDKNRRELGRHCDSSLQIYKFTLELITLASAAPWIAGLQEYVCIYATHIAPFAELILGLTSNVTEVGDSKLMQIKQHLVHQRHPFFLNSKEMRRWLNLRRSFL